MKRIFGGTRYANVTATMALIIALGGTSYAAIKLPGNSVGAAQIKTGAVGTSEVKNGSLLSGDFKAGQLPAGAKGDTGAAGATGAKGDAGATGAKGDTGAAGAKGEDGAKGETGMTGPAGSAKAAAYVVANQIAADPGVTVPAFKGPHPGFTAVKKATNDGVYCLTPAAGITVYGVPVLASAEFGASGVSIPIAQVNDRFYSSGLLGGCTNGDLIIATQDGAGDFTPVANVNFYVAVL
jgi:hypothetical protein